MKSMLCGAALATLAGSVIAISTAHGANAGGNDASDTELTEVTVTGSRVILNGNDAPTPVSVITPEQVLATKPANLYENLAEMPVFSGSRGASNGPVSTNPQGAGAVSTLNLRNMGPLRTLVLFDGHRVPPFTPDGLIDASTLPQMLVQRVDVVTGGASAVYGSDAVTGVVNYVTDAKFNGVKLIAQRGMSAQDDDASYEVGVAAGTSLFGGRGHIEGSLQRINDSGLYDYQRSWYSPRWSVYGNGTSIPWHLQANAGVNTASFGGTITCPNGTTLVASGCPGTPLAGLTFNQNGVGTPYNPGLSGAANGLNLTTVQIGGDGAYFVNTAMKSANRQDQAFGRFDFDVTDTLHAYVAGSWSADYVSGNTGTQRTFPPGVVMGACNAFLAAQYQTTLGCTTANSGAANEPTFRFEKQFNSLDNFGMGQNNALNSHNYFTMASLEGKFGSGYRWDATYTHSQTKLNIQGLNQNRQKLYAGVDAVVNPANGQIVCRITLTNPSVLPGCVPLNLFGPTAGTRDMAYYWFDTIQNWTTNKLDGLSGSLSGAPLNGWAGPIDMALSVEMRKLTMDLDTNSKSTDLLDCTGLRFGNCNPTVPVHPNTWLPVFGVNQTVTEGAYEFNLPLIKDRGAFRTVNFNGAARYTRYKNDPNDATLVSRTITATTWKAGLVWDLPKDLTVRWSRSRDIRAPSLYDLYLPITTGNTTNSFDFLQSSGGVAIFPRAKSGGNPYLDPELGFTTTLGLVYRPSSNFSVSLDAYQIVMRNALFSLSGASETVQKACYASGGSSPLCQLQERPFGCCTNTTAANAATAFYTRFVNLAQQKTSGIDLEANFNTRMLDRPVSFRALVTYQPHILYYVPFAPVQDVAGVVSGQLGGLPAPVWKGSVYAHIKLTDRLAVDVAQRYRSRLHFSSDPTMPLEEGGVGSVHYTNLSLSYDMPVSLAQASLFLNVQNLFNKEPPPASTINPAFPGGQNSTFAVGDDIVGAYYVVGMRVRL